MKHTGIVRRIDNLGRIVIPKELRRVYDIPEGTPMEVCTQDDMIILKKFTGGTLDSRIQYFFDSLVTSSPAEMEKELRQKEQELKQFIRRE